MALTALRVDESEHTRDGLLLHAMDGPAPVLAFISRRVMDEWARLAAPSSPRPSLFRGQYNALGRRNLAAIETNRSREVCARCSVQSPASVRRPPVVGHRRKRRSARARQTYEVNRSDQEFCTARSSRSPVCGASGSDCQVAGDDGT